MNVKNLIVYIVLFMLCASARAQYVQSSTKIIMDEIEQYQLQNQSTKANELLDTGIENTTAPADLAYLYAYKTGIYASIDSLLMAKEYADQSMKYAQRAKTNTAMAVAYRARAFLNNRMNIPDAVVKDALDGLKEVENTEEDPVTKYNLNSLLYGAYSKWDDVEKMENYIRKALIYAVKANSINLQVNAINGISSMYLAKFKKEKDHHLRDSVIYYLENSFELQKHNTDKVNGNTFVITCINIANYYLDLSTDDLSIREENALKYLHLAEEKLRNNEATSEKWMNIFGIKSGFAKKQNEPQIAEKYLLQGLSQLINSNGNYYKLEYAVNKDLAGLSRERDDLKSALAYQQRAEELLKKIFNEQQLFNAQKLEVQYETDKTVQELNLSKERENFNRRQN